MLTKDEVARIKEQWEAGGPSDSAIESANIAHYAHIPALVQTVEELRGLLVGAEGWVPEGAIYVTKAGEHIYLRPAIRAALKERSDD